MQYNIQNIISSSCKKILDDLIGYRNDSYSTGHYKIKEVIDFEINQLFNDDIIETCKIFYGTDDVYALISRHYPQKEFGDLWGLWLTTEKGVVEHYKGKEEGYSAYSVPKNSLVISDLSDEGILLVLPENPKSYFIQ
jgi:hypothetical protein